MQSVHCGSNGNFGFQGPLMGRVQAEVSENVVLVGLDWWFGWHNVQRTAVTAILGHQTGETEEGAWFSPNLAGLSILSGHLQTQKGKAAEMKILGGSSIHLFLEVASGLKRCLI